MLGCDRDEEVRWDGAGAGVDGSVDAADVEDDAVVGGIGNGQGGIGGGEGDDEHDGDETGNGRLDGPAMLSEAS